MSIEMNKIFAAILVAGIVAKLAGFVAEEMVEPRELEKNAVEIDGSAFASGAGGGAAVEAKADPILALIATADAAKGEQLTKACAACHNFDKGGENKTGPDLWNVTTRGRAAKADFSYSDGMKKLGGHWSYLDLNKFLWKPKKFVPDTKMNFIGLKNPQDRADVIAFLRTRADAPWPMPSQGEIDAEAKELAPAAPAAPADTAASPAGTVTPGKTEGAVVPSNATQSAPPANEPATQKAPGSAPAATTPQAK